VAPGSITPDAEVAIALEGPLQRGRFSPARTLHEQEGMSQRAHMWIRLVALAILVAIACLPRSERENERAGRLGGGGGTAEVARK
jgi:hypothetical protein